MYVCRRVSGQKTKVVLTCSNQYVKIGELKIPIRIIVGLIVQRVGNQQLFETAHTSRDDSPNKMAGISIRGYIYE